MTMMADDAGGKQPDAITRALKKRKETERVLQHGLKVIAHQRNDDKHAKQSVDHAGHSGEKIDEELQGIGNSRGSQLSQENCRPDAKRYGNQERNRSGDERAVNEGQRSELTENGVPDGGAEKIEAELVPRENGALPQVENKEQGDQNDGSGE